jgi:hypothetical protein
MKNNLTIRSLVLLAAVFSLLLTAAAPAPLTSSPAAATQAGELVRLTIENRTDKPLKIWLSGPAFYYLTVPAESTEVFTPTRGEYDYSLSACGITVRDTIDLSKNGRIIQPVCGIGRGQAAPAPNTVNMGVVAKLVKITFTNDTTGTIMLILTGPATYVFTMAKGEKTDYSIRRGDYDVHLIAYGCGLVTDTTFIARANYKKTFKCP